jgi:hypothetical protein
MALGKSPCSTKTEVEGKYLDRLPCSSAADIPSKLQLVSRKNARPCRLVSPSMPDAAPCSSAASTLLLVRVSEGAVKVAGLRDQGLVQVVLQHMGGDKLGRASIQLGPVG